MRSAVTLLLLVSAALVGPAEAAVSPDLGWQAPTETHVPSEVSDESELDEMHADSGERSRFAPWPSVASVDAQTLGLARATPPTPPPR